MTARASSHNRWRSSAFASIFGDNARRFVALSLQFTSPVFPRIAASWPGRRSRFLGGPVGASVMAHLRVCDTSPSGTRRDRNERVESGIGNDYLPAPFGSRQFAASHNTVQEGPRDIAGRGQFADRAIAFRRTSRTTAPASFFRFGGVIRQFSILLREARPSGAKLRLAIWPVAVQRARCRAVL